MNTTLQWKADNKRRYKKRYATRNGRIVSERQFTHGKAPRADAKKNGQKYAQRKGHNFTKRP